MAGHSCRLRALDPADLPVLADIYRDSIVRLGRACYTPEQIEAWAAFADDAAFDSWVQSVDTLVAVDESGRAIGFGGLDDSGRIASLYVAPDRMRRGVGSAILDRLGEAAVAARFEALTTEASHFSMALFRRHGFAVTAEEVVEFNGVSFHRYLMRKNLEPQPGGSAVRQPVPRVSSADVERVVTRDFGSAAAAPILAILDGYGGHNSHREPNRVRLAALKLAAGNRARLSELIEQAGLDYRDVLAAAEYPAYLGAGGFADERERARLIDADWRQYREWLFLPGSRSGPGAQQGAGPAGTGSVRQ